MYTTCLMLMNITNKILLALIFELTQQYSASIDEKDNLGLNLIVISSAGLEGWPCN